MRKRKIIALLLTLSLLLSSMTIFVSAADGTSGAQGDDAQTQSNAMIETLVTSKTGKFNGVGRPIYASDSVDAIVLNSLNGVTTAFTLNGNEKGGYGVLEVYDIKYGSDEFMRINPSIAGLEANDDKIPGNVYFGISSEAYAEYAIARVVGNVNASMSGASGYFVYDFELATEYLIPGMSFSPIVRAGKEGSYSLASMKHFSLSEYASYMDGAKWAHFTFIGDLKNNKVYLFINGKLATSQVFISSFPDATAEYDMIRLEGMRLATGNVKGNKGMNLYIDNVATRFYDGDDGTEAGLDAVVENMNIASFKDHYKDKGTTLPPVASIDGVIYNAISDVSSALGISADTPYQVDILRKFSGTISVNADAVINTHGYVDASSFTFADSAYYESEHGYITVDVPNAAIANAQSKKPSTSSEYSAASKSGVDGNMAIGVSMNPSDSVFVLSNFDNGSKCVEFNYLTTSINQIDIATGANKANYNLSKCSSGVFSFDLVSFSENVKGNYYLLFRNSGPNGYGTTNLSTLLKGVSTGEVAQITIAYGLKSGTEYYYRIYRNGIKIVNTTITIADSGMYFEALRLFPTGGHIGIDNIYSVVTNENVFDADGNLLDAYNQFNKEGYSKLTLPNVATIDGVEATTAGTATEILNKNALVYQQYVNVKHSFTGTIKVSVNAIIETNGFVGIDSFIFEDGVEYVEVGTKIISKTALNLNDTLTMESYPSSGTGKGVFTFPLEYAATEDNEWISSVQFNRKNDVYYTDISSVRNAYDGSKYYRLTVNPNYLANSNKTDTDTYVNISSGLTYSVDASAGTVKEILATANEEYYVFDVDLSTEGQFFRGFNIICTPAWVDANGNRQGKAGEYASTGGFSVANYVDADYKGWFHLTIVCDVKNNTRHIYINGEHKGTTDFANTLLSDMSSVVGIKVFALRLNTPSGRTLYEDANMNFANLSLRSFDASETALTSAVASKSSLTSWDKNHVGKAAEGEKAIVASVDGKAFSNVDDAVQYAMDNKSKNLSIYGEYTKVMKIEHDIKIYVMQGELKHISSTHTAEENGDGLYTFTKANSKEVSTVYVVYDKFAFLESNGASGYETLQFANGSLFEYDTDKIVASKEYEGKLYTFTGKWMYETADGAKEFIGKITADCNYKCLIPQYDTQDLPNSNGTSGSLDNAPAKSVPILNKAGIEYRFELLQQMRFTVKFNALDTHICEVR